MLEKVITKLINIIKKDIKDGQQNKLVCMYDGDVSLAVNEVLRYYYSISDLFGTYDIIYCSDDGMIFFIDRSGSDRRFDSIQSPLSYHSGVCIVASIERDKFYIDDADKFTEQLEWYKDLVFNRLGYKAE